MSGVTCFQRKCINTIVRQARPMYVSMEEATASRSSTPSPPPKPLGFEVVSATSAHSAHPASELTRGDGEAAGWLSSPLSDESPQDILLRLSDGRSSIHSIAILSHEYMIPQRIEIIIATNDNASATSENPATFDECSTIRRLGFVTLSDNAQSQYSARELKTVSIGEQRAHFVKLRLYACHPNELNIHNQVAILSLELIGYSTSVEEGTSVDGTAGSDDVGLLQVDGRSTMSSETDSDEVNGGDSHTDTSSDCRSTRRNPSSDARSPDDSGDENEQDEMDDEGSQGSHNGAVPSPTRIPATVAVAVPAPTNRPSSLHGHASAVSFPPPTLSGQEFMDQRQRADDEVQRRLERLDQIKLQRAAVEDFDCAARIKAVLSKTKNAFSRLSDLDSLMRQASEAEKYAEASKLKSQRDAARVEALAFLDDAEGDITKICGKEYDDEVAVEVGVGEEVLAVAESSPSSRSMQPFAEGQSIVAEAVNTDRRNESPSNVPVGSPAPGQPHDASAASLSPTPALVTKELQYASYPSPHPDDPLDNSAAISATKSSCQAKDNLRDNDSGSLSDDTATTFACASVQHQEEYNEDNHPLKGVPDYMALPAPEDINVEGGEIASDTIARIESLVGSYLARCFFSRNYSLREASLTKVSLMLPEMAGTDKEEVAVGGSSRHDNYLRTVSIMLERALNDRVIPVFVAALILLDDLISEMEQSGMSSTKEALSQLSVVTPCLVSHLGDNHNKVVEGAETALLSMALSRCIGPAYIANLLTKRTEEMRASRAIIARMRVAQTLMYEFGPDHGIPVEELMGWLSEHAVGHKDANVREAAKEVAITASSIIGRTIERYLHGMSERHRRAVMNSIPARSTTSTAIDRSARAAAKGEDSSGLRLNDDAHPNPLPPRRGRGRGRSRAFASH